MDASIQKQFFGNSSLKGVSTINVSQAMGVQAVLQAVLLRITDIFIVRTPAMVRVDS